MPADESKPRDFWGKLEITAKVIAAILITGAGAYFTYLYDLRSLEQERLLRLQQNQTAEITAVRAFIPHLVAQNNEEKKAALLILDSMGYSDFVAKFASSDQSKGSKEAGDIVMSRPELTTVARSPAAATGNVLGWVYLGSFGAENNSWNSRYFEFDKNTEPYSLKGQQLEVWERTGSLNIRRTPPASSGQLGDVTGVLKAGDAVRILEIEEWFGSGYMWAKVSH